MGQDNKNIYKSKELVSSIKHRKAKRASKNKMLVWIGAGIAVAAIAVACIFAFSPTATSGSPQTAQTTPTPTIIASPQTSPTPVATSRPTPSATTSTSPTPTAPADQGSWQAKFADKFTTGEVVKTDTSYRSANINASYQKVQKDGVTYYLVDIYLADLKYLQSAFANDKFAPGNRQYVDVMSKTKNAIAAINGDYCTVNPGPVVRDGVVYRSQTAKDVLVVYKDGTMKTFLKGQFDLKNEKTKDIWQTFTFGPQLLQDGQPMTKFNSGVTVANPRTSIGYYEPGHYCFVTVDGRQPGYSKGYNMTQLSQLFYDLGCKVAFNLDGGGSAQMAFMGKRINTPCGDFRKVDDMIYITDTP